MDEVNNNNNSSGTSSSAMAPFLANNSRVDPNNSAQEPAAWDCSGPGYSPADAVAEGSSWPADAGTYDICDSVSETTPARARGGSERESAGYDPFSPLPFHEGRSETHRSGYSPRSNSNLNASYPLQDFSDPGEEVFARPSEEALYSSHSNKSRQRNKRRIRAPRRPLSAYALFFREQRSRIMSSKEPYSQNKSTEQHIVERNRLEPSPTSGLSHDVSPLWCDKKESIRRSKSDGITENTQQHHMAREIKKRWRSLSAEQLAFYETKAREETDKYHEFHKEGTPGDGALHQHLPPHSYASAGHTAKRSSPFPPMKRHQPDQTYQNDMAQYRFDSGFSTHGFDPSSNSSQLPTLPEAKELPCSEYAAQSTTDTGTRINSSRQHYSVAQLYQSQITHPSPQLNEPNQIKLPPPRTVIVNDSNGVPKRYNLMYAAVSMPPDKAQELMRSMSTAAQDLTKRSEECDEGAQQWPPYS